MKLKVIKIDPEFRSESIELNMIVEVYSRSWSKPGEYCLIKISGKRFWYPKKCLSRLDSHREEVLKNIGI